MSQHASPYLPPNTPDYFGGSQDLLKPAKRASVMMFVLGGLLLVLGVCDVVNTITIPAEQILKQARQMQGGQFDLPIPPAQYKIFILITMSLILGFGITFIALAVGVRRGGKGSTITALVLTLVILACLSLMILVMLIASLQVPMALVMICLLLIPTGLIVPLTIWLIGATRALSRLASAQQQYMVQYWQYQQSMQPPPGYGIAASLPLQGYATAVPPPAVPPFREPE